MSEFLGYIGMGIVACALVAPLAYCEMRSREVDAELQKACIEAKGEWGTGWRKGCKLPEKITEEADG